jgi:hypothetical protein
VAQPLHSRTSNLRLSNGTGPRSEWCRFPARLAHQSDPLSSELVQHNRRGVHHVRVKWLSRRGQLLATPATSPARRRHPDRHRSPCRGATSCPDCMSPPQYQPPHFPGRTPRRTLTPGCAGRRRSITICVLSNQQNSRAVVPRTMPVVCGRVTRSADRLDANDRVSE